MTQQEQNLADDKMRAEIAKLMAETARINEELGRKIGAETDKIFSETRAINVNTFLAPALAAAALMGATAAVVKMFFV